jgi:fructan beta-fructosidase
MKMKNIFFITCMLLQVQSMAQKKLYTEQYRPQFHFSPAGNWCNDPNGLVYNKGTYHLFYQHNPFGNQWGHMTWGHATSTDLIHWKHQPIAIPEEKGIMIFSGTCVVDKDNTSGFGKDGKIPMVAVYTGHIENKNQSQHVAYSLDNGLTWTKYAHNPVLDLDKKDFRDPKIFWYEPKKYWVMSVMFPVEHMVEFYSSKNLLSWKHIGEFGPAGDTSGVWECPDLSQVPVDGMPGKKKWLLQTSQNAGMQYFVGEFDGEKFINENPSGKIFRPDYGPDYYAAISYNQLPPLHPPVSIGWVNNWNYANDIPTSPWKSAMSQPRNLSLKKINGAWILIQKPITRITSLRKVYFQLKHLLVNENYILPVHSTQFEFQADMEPSSAATCGLRFSVGPGTYFETGYDAARKIFYIDRSKSGNTAFNENFKTRCRFEKNISLKNNKIQLRVFFDNSIAEVFVNGGEAVFTAQLFPEANNTGIELFNHGPKSSFRNIEIWKINNAW